MEKRQKIQLQMKVYIVINDAIYVIDNINKVFLNKEDAEKYCNYSNQWIEEHEVIE